VNYLSSVGLDLFLMMCFLFYQDLMVAVLCFLLLSAVVIKKA